MKILSTTTFKDFNRPDIRLLNRDLFLPEPILLPAGNNEAESLEILEAALGFNETHRSITLTSPIEEVTICADMLKHVVDKRDNARERYANYIIPTITDPFEIYKTHYEDAIRNQYIGLFKGENGLLTVVNVDLSGSIFWNMMHCKAKKMNTHRKGELLYYNKKCSPVEQESIKKVVG